MREALTLVLSGLAAGVPLALVSARALKGVLFGVSSLDLPAYLAAVAVLLAIATLAAYLPARRASAPGSGGRAARRVSATNRGGSRA